MTPDLTEEEMRLALFGTSVPAAPVNVPATPEPAPEPIVEAVLPKPAAPAPKKKVAKAFTPRMRVTLRVGNEYEGETFELIHEADTLSTLLAEQEATKLARKKYRYVEVVSVKSM